MLKIKICLHNSAKSTHSYHHEEKGAVWIGSIQPLDKVSDGRSPKRFWYS
jgi:hypothetical protein